MKIGCVDVGGGVRDIYGAGVFDYMLDEGISVDYCIGVSAGSANCASFVAGQRGRNKKFYLDYLSRKEAISFKNYLKLGSFVDLNYVYGVLCKTDGENPLDYPAIIENKTELSVVATDAHTGKAVYFDKHSDMAQDDYKILMASSCFPVFCKPVDVGGKRYYDGGISDPIPFKKAFENGCDKVIIILTKPLDSPSSQKRNERGANVLKRRYPNFADAMNKAAGIYAKQLKEALQLQESGKALILAPDDIMGLGTFTRDVNKLPALYEKGYTGAAKIKSFLQS